MYFSAVKSTLRSDNMLPYKKLRSDNMLPYTKLRSDNMLPYKKLHLTTDFHIRVPSIYRTS
jgi:hypothetical protein